MRRRINIDHIDNMSEEFRAVVDDTTSLTIYREKMRTICIIKKNLAKDYDIEVDASEAPVLNKYLKNPKPYEISMADVKILDEQVFPINEIVKELFGEEKDLKLETIKLAVGSNNKDYVTIREKDLKKFDVKPTLSGLKEFITENRDSILGFLDCEYVSEEGNVIYLSCGKRDLTDNIYILDLKILSSMQQRGFFLQQEHKYYGLQFFITIEAKKIDDDKLLRFLQELNINWEIIFFRRRLAIHDWLEVECERDTENLKQYLRAKYDNLNYFDVNNIIRLLIKNQLPFTVADKMASLLSRMKRERSFQMVEKKYDSIHDSTDYYYSSVDKRNNYSNRYGERNQSIDEYSITLNKAEIVAAAKVACAYLGLKTDIKFDRDISTADILKYQEELANF
ncbi:MAG: hypothetical protein ACTSRH_02885 [Promethearchaeota archaeon]